MYFNRDTATGGGMKQSQSYYSNMQVLEDREIFWKIIVSSPGSWHGRCEGECEAGRDQGGGEALWDGQRGDELYTGQYLGISGE